MSDLAKRAEQRASDLRREQGVFEHARGSSDAAEARAFVLATSPWGFLGTGSFCYLFGLFGTIGLSILFIVTAPPLVEIPRRTGSLSFGAKCALCAVPILVAIVLAVAVPPRLRKTSGARALGALEGLPVRGLFHAIGMVSRTAMRELRLELVFADGRPVDDALLALARQAHPAASAEPRSDGVRLYFPLSGTRTMRLSSDDAGLPIQWLVQRAFFQLWEDIRVAVLEPLHKTHPLADVRVDEGMQH